MEHDKCLLAFQVSLRPYGTLICNYLHIVCLRLAKHVKLLISLNLLNRGESFMLIFGRNEKILTKVINSAWLNGTKNSQEREGLAIFFTIIP